MKLTKQSLRAMTLCVTLSLLTACQTPSSHESSKTPEIIASANLVPRDEACRALKYAQISRDSSADLIAYVVALDAQWQSFCGEG